MNDDLKGLWQSVIMQAVLDALKIPKTAMDKIENKKTISWFSMKNEDFILVCSLADMDPLRLVQNVKRSLLKNASKTT